METGPLAPTSQCRHVWLRLDEALTAGPASPLASAVRPALPLAARPALPLATPTGFGFGFGFGLLDRLCLWLPRPALPLATPTGFAFGYPDRLCLRSDRFEPNRVALPSRTSAPNCDSCVRSRTEARRDDFSAVAAAKRRRCQRHRRGFAAKTAGKSAADGDGRFLTHESIVGDSTAAPDDAGFAKQGRAEAPPE